MAQMTPRLPTRNCQPGCTCGRHGPRKWLTERNEEIVKLRRSGMTLQQVGERFQITRERVRQIVERFG